MGCVVTPTIQEMVARLLVTPAVAALILAVIHGDVDPTQVPYSGAFPDTVAWVRRCHHKPSHHEIVEHAVGELLGFEFDGLEVECAPTYRFFGTYVGRFVGSYANRGDPHVATIVHSYRDLGDGEGGFEEDGWYVCGWADLLEAAEAHYREDDSSEEDD